MCTLYEALLGTCKAVTTSESHHPTKLYYIIIYTKTRWENHCSLTVPTRFCPHGLLKDATRIGDFAYGKVLQPSLIFVHRFSLAPALCFSAFLCVRSFVFPCLSVCVDHLPSEEVVFLADCGVSGGLSILLFFSFL